ncbi:hypothetical protein VHN57_02350 [Sphingobium sp. WW5]|uniref:hypothetical protein n=1 Tax=unclassified Sphingobium TaxID=2611147 RepID=UPI003C24D47A
MTSIEDETVANPMVRWVGNGMAAAAIIAICLYLLDHQLGWIDCWAFEWGDFATLATGAGAVAGAVWVGRIQTKISDRQTEILGHQVEIERISMRAELYDRRMKCFSDIVIFSSNTGFSDENSTGITFRDFSIAVETVQFLFNDDIYGVAVNIRRHVMAYRTLKIDIDNWDRFDATEREDQIRRSKRSAAAARAMVEDFAKLAAPMMRVDEHQRI